jgi:hypothetical protein
VAARPSDAQILTLIREALGGEGLFTVSVHAEKNARRWFEDSDVRRDRLGRLTRREPDMKGDRRFTIEGPAIDDPGKSVGVVCKLLQHDPPEVLVITVFDESTRYGRRRTR